jgi:hypothetical protein
VGAVVLHIYAMRMAAVFTISTATIGLRSGFIPRWLGFGGYVVAAVLLLTIDVTPWVELLFPLWGPAPQRGHSRRELRKRPRR